MQSSRANIIKPPARRIGRTGARALGKPAPGQTAGFIFQLERALEHLCDADSGTAVGVETLDDVTVVDGSVVRVREQDKHSIRDRVEVLSDRSVSLWKSLAIWLNAIENARSVRSPAIAERLLLVTNQALSTPLVCSLKLGSPRSPSDVAAIIAEMRRVGAPPHRRRRPVNQDIFDAVLAHTDDQLAALISRIEVLDQTAFDASRRQRLANRLAISGRVDCEIVLDAVFGWLIRTLMEAWRAGVPGWVTRRACVEQCRAIEAQQARRRFFPMPRSRVPVEQAQRDEAMARPFVGHLVRINAEDEDVSQAIEHFVQFNVEKHRLTNEGEIPDDEWTARGGRLSDRWRNIARQTRRDHVDRPPSYIGLKILEATTYYHCEPLAGEPCPEIYMTAGHYHRLADGDQVWWHPDYEPSLRPGRS